MKLIVFISKKFKININHKQKYLDVGLPYRIIAMLVLNVRLERCVL